METVAQPAKKDVARALLLRGSVFVHLDPRSEAVEVPTWLKDQPQLVLQVGLDMPIPIPDLRIDDDGLHGTLSFRQSPFRCKVGWGAVFALVGEDGRGMIWPEALPTEIAREVERESIRHGFPSLSLADMSLDEPTPDGSADGGLRLVSQDGDTDEDVAADPSQAVHSPRPGKSPRSLPPYLRVIK